MKLRALLEQLQPLEDVILDHEQEFLEEFCPNGTDIIKLSFSSENCYFVYLAKDGPHTCNHISVSKLAWWLHAVGINGGF